MMRARGGGEGVGVAEAAAAARSLLAHCSEVCVRD